MTLESNIRTIEAAPGGDNLPQRIPRALARALADEVRLRPRPIERDPADTEAERLLLRANGLLETTGVDCTITGFGEATVTKYSYEFTFEDGGETYTLFARLAKYRNRQRKFGSKKNSRPDTVGVIYTETDEIDEQLSPLQEGGSLYFVDDDLQRAHNWRSPLVPSLEEMLPNNTENLKHLDDILTAIEAKGEEQREQDLGEEQAVEKSTRKTPEMSKIARRVLLTCAGGLAAVSTTVGILAAHHTNQGDDSFDLPVQNNHNSNIYDVPFVPSFGPAYPTVESKTNPTLSPKKPMLENLPPSNPIPSTVIPPSVERTSPKLGSDQPTHSKEDPVNVPAPPPNADYPTNDNWHNVRLPESSGDFNQEFYDWCMEIQHAGENYCRNHSGG